jgi:trehalose 6-phosphate synthase/phosphatase
MSQVIIVSNRLPISVKKENGKLSFSSSIGGLATGLSSYVNRKNGNLWIGWPGIESDDLTKSDREDITNR